MKRGWFILSFVIIVLLLVIFLILKTDKGKDVITNFKENLVEDNQETINTENKEQTNINLQDDSQIGSSGNGESSDSSSKLNCYIQQITYSIINFNKTEICNQYQDEICIDKTVTCSAEIHNREDIESGFFEIELMFLEKAGDKENPIDSSTSRFFLDSKEYKVFKDSTIIQSNGEDGLANKRINCFFNTIEVPEKEVC